MVVSLYVCLFLGEVVMTDISLRKRLETLISEYSHRAEAIERDLSREHAQKLF